MKFRKVLAVFLALITLMLSSCGAGETQTEQPLRGGLATGDFSVNEVIDSLSYNVDEIVPFRGNTAGKFVVRIGTISGSKYYVFNRSKEIKDESFMPVIHEEHRDVIYPGALLLANDGVLNGAPQSLNVENGSVVITLDFADGYTQIITVDEATDEKVQNAIEEAENAWYASHGGEYTLEKGGEYRVISTYDEKTLQLDLGIDKDYAENVLGIDFEHIALNDKAYCVVEYKCVLYTATVESYENPADAFGDSVSGNQLIENGVDDANPPAYVSKVEYGRQTYFVFESYDFPDILYDEVNDACYRKGGALAFNTNLTGMQLLMRSYSAGEAVTESGDIRVTASDIEAVNKMIPSYGVFSESDGVAPLDYSLSLVKDNHEIELGGQSEYILLNTEIIESGEIHLSHKGGYVAEFYVSWDEITGYRNNGEPITKRVEWKGNGFNRTAGYTTVITLDGNCTNIDIKARGKTGLVWDKWRTSVDVKGLELVPKRTVKIWGTTLDQKASVDPKDW